MKTFKRRFFIGQGNVYYFIKVKAYILEGLLIVYVDIDTVIKIIRQSDEPKKELIKKFKISEIQANAILEIKLRQLAKLEQIKLEEESKLLKNEKNFGYLAYQNFDNILKWNRSNYFAIAVGSLSDHILYGK